MQKEGPALAKWQKQTEKPEAFAAVTLGICCSVRPRTAHLPKRAGDREAGGARGGPNGGTERHNHRPPCARSHNVVPTEKRGSKRLKPWAFFRLIGELFADGLHRVRHPRRRKKRDRRNRRKSSRANARASPSFCFSPSPIGSNSVVHNALWVKISHILTQRNHHTTHSGSTACG